MRRLVLFCLVLALASLPIAAGDPPKAPPPDWAMNATIIEACSCPMFCQCFFTDEPAQHHDHQSGKMEHFCKANMAIRVNRGFYGATRLEGATFWMAGDLGEKLSDGLEWGVLTFDPSVSPEQRQAIRVILSHVYPFPVKDFQVAKDAPIEWRANADRAVGLLDGGKAGEIVLKRFQGNTDEPVVIKNLKYIGAPRNDGFNLMPNEVEAYHLGDKAFEFRHTNGFTVTIDITSKDVMPNTAN
jgi:hypothetical protein